MTATRINRCITRHIRDNAGDRLRCDAGVPAREKPGAAAELILAQN